MDSFGIIGHHESPVIDTGVSDPVIGEATAAELKSKVQELERETQTTQEVMPIIMEIAQSQATSALKWQKKTMEKEDLLADKEVLLAEHTTALRKCEEDLAKCKEDLVKYKEERRNQMGKGRRRRSRRTKCKGKCSKGKCSKGKCSKGKCSKGKCSKGKCSRRR